MGEEGLAKSSYNIYSGLKSLVYSLICFIYGIYGEGGLVENVICGEGVG